MSESGTPADKVEHWAECGTCDQVLEVEDGSVEGFDRCEDALANHIDDGTACHGGRVMVEYEDGGVARVL